jgi:4'-phosphopantetheinyl transferase
MLISWCLLEPTLNGVGLQHPPDLLSPAEQQRLERMRFPKRRAEWLSGREAGKRLLVLAVPQYAHLSLTNIEIENEPEGAPYFQIDDQRSPLCLSLSHSGELALAAIASVGISVGIDIERVEPRTQAFFEDYFTLAEMQCISSLPADLRDLGITLLWSAKEAVLKAWGKGLRLDTRTLDIDLMNSLAVSAELPLGWQVLRVESHTEGMPPCSLMWQPYRDYVITLAHTGAASASIEQVSI